MLGRYSTGITSPALRNGGAYKECTVVSLVARRKQAETERKGHGSEIRQI